jgi:hypothetical protein
MEVFCRCGSYLAAFFCLLTPGRRQEWQVMCQIAVLFAYALFFPRSMTMNSCVMIRSMRLSK